MSRFGEVWQSSVLQKWIMAVTGILIVGFLLGHLSGNLLIFLGPDHMNSYAVELRELLHGSALWVVRAGLILIFILHVRAGIILSLRNKKAKGGKYAVSSPITSTLSSRTMLWSGLLLLAYVFYHLAHFTWGAAHSEFYHYTDSLGRHDVYRMVIESFHQPLIVTLYVIAMVVTALHLNHAISSAFQTIGVNHVRYTPMIKKGGLALSALILLGFLSVPLAIFFGVVK